MRQQLQSNVLYSYRSEMYRKAVAFEANHYWQTKISCILLFLLSIELFISFNPRLQLCPVPGVRSVSNQAIAVFLFWGVWRHPSFLLVYFHSTQVSYIDNLCSKTAHSVLMHPFTSQMQDWWDTHQIYVLVQN